MSNAAALLVAVTTLAPGLQKVCLDEQCVTYRSSLEPSVLQLDGGFKVFTPYGWLVEDNFKVSRDPDECRRYYGSGRFVTQHGIVIDEVCGHDDGFTIYTEESRKEKRVFRRFNTYGIYVLGTVIGFVLIYSILSPVSVVEFEELRTSGYKQVSKVVSFLGRIVYATFCETGDREPLTIY